jgi:hypothetical protein
MATIEHRSLRVNVLDLIGKFLFDEGFSRNPHLSEGILNLIDSTSSYHEEGEELFPEIFITDSISNVLATLPFSKIIEIAENDTTVGEFNKVLKLCAPLSRDGWVIYINVHGGRMSYGLVSTEISELSPAFRIQAVGELSENKDQYSIAYLQNVGNKSVLLKGSLIEALISLSLSSNDASFGEELSKICNFITSDVHHDFRKTANSYFEKIIGEAAIVGHGNLIGVIRDNEDSLLALRHRHPDGIYLKKPIDISGLLIDSEESSSREASTVNRLYSSIVQSMLNHDGLTVFTSSGKLIGYHIFVKPNESEPLEVVGGARSRAFEVMKGSDVFCCCFYKSQDGNEQVWSESNV